MSKPKYKYVRIQGKELAKNTMYAKGIFSMCWQLIQEDVMEEEDADLYIVLENASLDVEALAAEDLMLDMPSKFLCQEDCKGLCPTCGKNLNDGPCDCAKEVDPRLAALAELLDD